MFNYRPKPGELFEVIDERRETEGGSMYRVTQRADAFDAFGVERESITVTRINSQWRVLDPDEKAQLDRIEAMLAKLFAEPADDGSPGRSVETLEIAVFINQLRKQGASWKEVLKACKERWPDDNHVRNVEQVRATFRRFFRSKPD